MRAVILLLLLVFNLYAVNLKVLLNQIEKNEDLSLKTKQESAGISYVITRYQLDMMQARYLRDILKNTVVGYEISRYGVLDPWSANNLPYASSGIRVFIDNQEITTAKYDNGLFLLGNVDLSFVDHIEVYYLSPSYKISTEPAYVIIKLYSKDPARDEGKRVELTYGTFKSNSEVFDYANGKRNYYFHFSNNFVGHKKTDIENVKIGRNNLNHHFFFTYRNDNTSYLLSGIYQNQDPFMGVSMEGKLDDGYEKYKEVHFGLEHKLNGWNLKYTLDYLKDETYFYEQSGLFYRSISTFPYIEAVQTVKTKGYDVVNTLKLNTEKIHNNHRLVYGASFRNKLMDIYELYLNNEESDYEGIKRQDIYTLFFEDNIQIKENIIATAGYEYSKYVNDKVKDCKLHQYKATATYLANEKNIFKFSFQHIEYAVPPYYYKTFYGDRMLKPQKNDVIIAKYKKVVQDIGDFELVGFYGINKNFPIMLSDGTLDNMDDNIYVKMVDLKYHKNYNILNDFILDFIYLKLKNVVLHETYKVVVLNTHRYGKYNLFENVVYKKNNYTSTSKDGVDLSLGVKYNCTKNLSFSLKGENLLNRDYENSFIRVTNINPVELDSENIQLIERRVTAGMEYWF